MNTTPIKINKHAGNNCQIAWSLSFRPLVAYLKKRLKTEETIKKEFYRFLLEKIENEGALSKNISIEDLPKYKDTLELIFTILTPLMANEKELYWALSTPIPDQIFFSTDLLYNFIQQNVGEKGDGGEEYHLKKEKDQVRFIYKVILERFYNYSMLDNSEMLFAYDNPSNGLTQYYHVNIDTQFVDITYSGDQLPELNFEQFSGFIKDDAGIEELKSILPIADFRFDGFTILTVNDVSLQHAIEGMREALANHNYQIEAYGYFIQTLRTLGGNAEIEFGLLPLITVNGKPILDSYDDTSIIISTGKDYGLEEKIFFDELERYKNDPKPLFFNTITDQQVEQTPFMGAIRASGIKSYSILPVFYSSQLVGILEIYSKKEVIIDDKLLSRLQTAMPFLGQLFQYRIEEFNAKMDEVLMDKFTALQPSVQWKFNQKVWEFIEKNKGNKNAQDIETVTFKKLYPLFGAVDIRNSTVERNIALKEDLKLQLQTLVTSLKRLKEVVKIDLIDKILHSCEQWANRMDSAFSSSDEDSLDELLENEVYPMLQHVLKTHPATKPIVDDYFLSVDPETGSAFQHRRRLENAMQFINASVGEYLENAQEALQQTFPFYFAKFRTDGVEYDIYIGQEIAPEVPFDMIYLKNMRLWQLQSMIDITKMTQKLVDEMEKPLFTTQLIFIHSNPIDISFRNDERRFDVEGSYNIRYEVIKKRIDKVNVKGKNERLTQPGKIALVYYNTFEANEYLTYISYLQQQGQLLGGVEQLELEELQGITGLRALRVTVNVDMA